MVAPVEFPGAWWRVRHARPLVAVGVLLVVSGFAHLLVWAVVGGPWEGPITWRKPILFGISGGFTSLSLAWAFARLAPRWGDGILAWTTALALLIEVVLIDVQRWRGVASHFNRTTTFDSVLYDVIGGLIVFVTLVVIDLTVRFCRRPPRMEPDMLLAARAGLALLSVSCVLGIWTSAHGELRMMDHRAPEFVGTAGVAKFPHGAVIHAVQWLPLLGWAARRAGVAEPARLRLVATQTAGTVLILAYALVQTFSGRGRFDALPAATALLTVGGIALAVPVIVTAWAWIRSARRSPPPRAGLSA